MLFSCLTSGPSRALSNVQGTVVTVLPTVCLTWIGADTTACHVHFHYSLPECSSHLSIIFCIQSGVDDPATVEGTSIELGYTWIVNSSLAEVVLFYPWQPLPIGFLSSHLTHINVSSTEQLGCLIVGLGHPYCLIFRLCSCHMDGSLCCQISRTHQGGRSPRCHHVQ